jgi:small subunit ribosomal protein S1
MTKENLNMEQLLKEQEESFKPLENGDNVEGTVISVAKNGIWMDLGPHGVGLVVGPELRDKSIVGALNPGDKISASVLEVENEEGQPLLSLKKASREKVWDNFKKIRDEKRLISVKPFDSNKGGLLIEFEGVRGFLPVSQLSTENYPRVADKDEINPPFWSNRKTA